MSHKPQKTCSKHLTGTRKEILFQAAACIADSVFRAVEDHGFCSLVLSGGSSPKRLYRMLAEGVPVSTLQEQGLGFPEETAVIRHDIPVVMLPWKSVMLFWGDERCVPEDHPDSNFGMARQSLMTGINIPERNIFPMPHVTENYDEAALCYERELKHFFNGHRQSLRKSFPVFDLILLGMGPDGHTASLFPGDRNTLEESNRWVIPVHAPQGSPPGYRLSLTLPVINNAESVMFFVTGQEKEEMVLDITSNRRPDLPAGMIRPEKGRLAWFYSKE